jgi:SAM-dependent methyltransferase
MLTLNKSPEHTEFFRGARMTHTDQRRVMSKPELSQRSSSAELSETYARRFANQELRRREVWDTLTRHFFQQWVGPCDTVLDLGAGYCEFINSVRAKRKLALDLNPATISKAGEGVKVLSQDVSQVWDISPASVDVLFTSNFLEHLATKELLTHCLREARRILRPGGRIIALGPNIRFAYDLYWDFFDHYLPLSDRSLVEALELNGFKPELVLPRFLPFTMQGRTSANPLLVRVYLAFPIAWRIFGRQFLVIASK